MAYTALAFNVRECEGSFSAIKCQKSDENKLTNGKTKAIQVT